MRNVHRQCCSARPVASTEGNAANTELGHDGFASKFLSIVLSARERFVATGQVKVIQRNLDCWLISNLLAPA
jgi:hypothetical protein